MPKMNASPPQKEDQVATAHQSCKAECLTVPSTEHRQGHREGENRWGPEAQGYWVGQAALALRAGSGIMSAEIRENLEDSSTQRGLY